MKKHILLLITLAIATSANAQFYVSGSSGYSLGSAGMKLGTEITTTTGEINSYGSYGEGVNFQFKGGYFFNNTFGLELGLGYVHGTDQTITKINSPSQEVEAIARARALGFTTSLVYNFTDNLYGRFGALIKVGGKTEALVYSKTANGDGTFAETNYTEDYHGQLPLGFVGAFGFKHNIGSNLDLFVEAEYMGVSVKRKDSEIQKFNTDIILADGTVAVAGFYSLDNLPPGYVIKSNYEDEVSLQNTDPSVKLSQKVPYSSFGLNFGITYTFSKKEAK